MSKNLASAFQICPDCGVDLGLTLHKPWCDDWHQKVGALVDINTSGLEPQGQAVLLKPYDPEVKASPIIMPENVKRQLDMVETRAIVIAIGPDAWLNEQTGIRGTPRAKIGDKVLVSKYCGALIRGTLDDVQYRMVNGRDIYARIVAEKEGSRSEEAPREPMVQEDPSNG